MSRLPLVNGDDGNWGTILNDFLSVSLASGGALNNSTVNTVQIVDGAVTTAKITGVGAANGVASLNASAVVPDVQLPTRLGTSALNAAYAPIAAAMPASGSTGQILSKNSGTSYDAVWVTTPFANVTVSTGTEARPAANFVLWVGGSTQPTNMANGDVWMKAS
jgi:hypothetical protein